MRVAPPVLLALAMGGCGLFLDDLSSESGDPSGDGGSPRDVSTAEPDPGDATTSDASNASDAGSDALTDTGIDAPKWTPRLDCDGAVLCEGFESISNIQPGQPCGVYFDQIDENNGEASIETTNPALGIRAARFASLANGTGSGQTLLIGDNNVALASGRSEIDIDFDMWLDYDPAQLDGDERRNLVGVYLKSTNTQANWEFGGLSLMAAKGLHGEMREFAAASSTVRTGAEDPFVTLGPPSRKAWHHYRLEMTFAKTKTGGMKIYVDGVLTGQLPSLLTRTNGSDGSTSFIFWVGASAGAGAPQLTALYDDVEVRTR